mmetsp:Transcript_6577/g.16136  ORF Transcript_6577/g.16136 Transcript_6577/m.16136 type:complete len:86 (-) Transcript_6577:116-373(-)
MKVHLNQTVSPEEPPGAAAGLVEAFHDREVEGTASLPWAEEEEVAVAEGRRQMEVVRVDQEDLRSLEQQQMMHSMEPKMEGDLVE